MHDEFIAREPPPPPTITTIVVTNGFAKPTPLVAFGLTSYVIGRRMNDAFKSMAFDSSRRVIETVIKLATRIGIPDINSGIMKCTIMESMALASDLGAKSVLISGTFGFSNRNMKVGGFMIRGRTRRVRG